MHEIDVSIPEIYVDRRFLISAEHDNSEVYNEIIQIQNRCDYCARRKVAKPATAKAFRNEAEG